MKKIIVLLIAISCMNFLSCTTSDDSIDAVECGFHNGNQLFKGPRGGCYYYNSNGNKTYVERNECNC